MTSHKHSWNAGTGRCTVCGTTSTAVAQKTCVPIKQVPDIDTVPVSIFAAEDFPNAPNKRSGALYTSTDAAEEANARLAPLVEALDRLARAHDVTVSDNPGGRTALKKAFDDSDAAVTILVAEYRKLWRRQ